MDKFPCTSCGSCCKRVGLAAKELSGDLSFPYGYDENGKCEMLDDNNQCKVYDDRPLICNIEKMMTYFGESPETFFPANIMACNKMMDEDGVDESFRILVSP